MTVRELRNAATTATKMGIPQPTAELTRLSQLLPTATHAVGARLGWRWPRSSTKRVRAEPRAKSGACYEPRSTIDTPWGRIKP